MSCGACTPDIRGSSWRPGGRNYRNRRRGGQAMGDREGNAAPGICGLRRAAGALRDDGRAIRAHEKLAEPRAFSGPDRRGESATGAELDGIDDLSWRSPRRIRGAGGGGGVLHFAVGGDGGRAGVGLRKIREVAAGGRIAVWHQTGGCGADHSGVVESGAGGAEKSGIDRCWRLRWCFWRRWA